MHLQFKFGKYICSNTCPPNARIQQNMAWYSNGMIKDLACFSYTVRLGVPRSPDILTLRIWTSLGDEKRVVHFKADSRQIWCIIHHLLIGATPADQVVDSRLS